MKIGVVSDTHSHKIPRQMLEDFKDVEMIIHVGDICCQKVLDKLEQIKPVIAVFGNMDESPLKENLPRKRIIECGQFSIGCFHGEGPPFTLLDKVKNEFKKDKVQAVVFGHSHHPFNKVINKVLYFNPGSPNDLIFAPYRSYGLLEIDKTISGKIVKVKDNDE